MPVTTRHCLNAVARRRPTRNENREKRPTAPGGSRPATPTALPADTSCLPTVLNPEYRHAVIAYEVSSPADATLLAVFLREQGYEARSRGTHLWATRQRRRSQRGATRPRRCHRRLAARASRCTYRPS